MKAQTSNIKIRDWCAVQLSNLKYTHTETCMQAENDDHKFKPQAAKQGGGVGIVFKQMGHVSSEHF